MIVLTDLTEPELVLMLAEVLAEYDRRSKLLGVFGTACHPITAEVLERMPADVRNRAEAVLANRAARRRISS